MPHPIHQALSKLAHTSNRPTLQALHANDSHRTLDHLRVLVSLTSDTSSIGWTEPVEWQPA